MNGCRKKLGFLLLLFSIAGQAADKCSEFGRLADGRVIQQAIQSLNHSEKVRKHEKQLTILRNQKAEIEKYISPDSPFSYPNSLLFFAVMRLSVKSKWHSDQADFIKRKVRLHVSLGKAAVADAHETLKTLFSRVPLKAPESAEEAAAQSDAIAREIAEVRRLLGTAFKAPRDVEGVSAWPNPKELLAMARSYNDYFAGNVDPSSDWSYLNYIRDFWIPQGSDFVIVTGNLRIDPKKNLPDPRLSHESGFLGKLGLAPTLGQYTRNEVKKLIQLDRAIKVEEQTIAKLLGAKPAPLAKQGPIRYVASEPVARAIAGVAPSGVAQEVLRYREQLIAKYLDGHGFFSSENGKEILSKPDLYESIFASFDPVHIPRAKGDGTYDAKELAAFRDLTDHFKLTPEKFLQYSAQLHDLFLDSQAKKEFNWIIRDRREGGAGMEALRFLAGAEIPMPQLPLPVASTNEPEVTAIAKPYARSMTPAVQYHEALTALALETARRGEKAQAGELLRDVATAAQTLQKSLRQNALTRGNAIEKLSPAIDRGIQNANALALDLAHMEHDLDGLRQALTKSLIETTARAKVFTNGTSDPAALAMHPAALEELGQQMDQLKSQLADADHLAQTLGLLKGGLKEGREYLSALQSLLRRSNPIAPNLIDNVALAEVLQHLPKSRR